MGLLTKTKPTRKIIEITKRLGCEFSIKWIDGENCIYRKMNSDFDIEISGLDNRKQSFSCTIFLWSISSGKTIEATYPNIKSFEQLCETLQSLEMLYG